ncbi:hypothetical protein DSO57_1010542 [Entomophthora muscae]|uniref:Uncharacterized protein n=1 Tax=Entomophthora muscae TaxID=34485 RepID=A0ACC2SVC1_9FUNG|nr:hypothetical protein DSO57_1010542 [Entomophthora muscae]
MLFTRTQMESSNNSLPVYHNGRTHSSHGISLVAISAHINFFASVTWIKTLSST